MAEINPASGLANTVKPSRSTESDYALVEGRRGWVNSGFEQIHRVQAVLPVVPGEWANALDRLTQEVLAGGIVALVGIRGTGKTQLAANAARQFCLAWKDGDHPCRVMYRPLARLFREIRATFGDIGSEVENVNQVCKAGLVVIDEMQEVKKSEWELNLFTEIIDRRYGRQTATVIISNLSRTAFAEFVGPSVVSRLHEVGTMIECNWPSFRTK